MRLQFQGGVGNVTGSRTQVHAWGTRVLVDCGLYQGPSRLRARNREPIPGAWGLNAVVLTHAHLDHSGLLPKLVADGFRGPIHCTDAAAALLEVLLRDAAHLMAEDARRRGTAPTYTNDDVEAALGLLAPRRLGRPFRVGELEVKLSYGGHMLGASSVTLRHGQRSVCFSGDVGRVEDPLLHPPEPFAGADVLVLESTYGDRRHPRADIEEELGEVVREVCGRGGVLMIPAFAIGRSQTVLHLLARLMDAGQIPHVPVFLNSPMAISATEIYCEHASGHRLSRQQCERMCGLASYVRFAEDSKLLNQRKGPMIVIAGSGMISGGRILHHLKAFGADPVNGLLLVGFQAAGTRGAMLQGGTRSLRLFGRQQPIRASIHTISGLSGHADQDGLIDWLRAAPGPTRVLVNHGEPGPALALAARIRETLNWEASPAPFDEWVQV